MNTHKSIALELLILFLCVIFCVSLSGVLTLIIFKIIGYNFVSNNDITPMAYIIAGFFNQLIGFIGAFLLYLKLTKQSFSKSILISAPKYKLMTLTFVLLVLSFPTVSWLASINENLKTLIPNNSFILEGEATQQLQQKLLTDPSVLLLILKIVVIGIVTAFAEELIFRGVLLKKIETSSNNKHYAVIVSALIFAIVHLQPLMLLPMFFLGLVLGYLYTQTKNLSYSILFHALFNTSTILIGYFYPELLN